jgi:predicted nucleic acid-binding protein
MTLFDTSVVIDARDTASPWHEWAKEQVAGAGAADGAMVNPVVIAEAAGGFAQRDELLKDLERMGLSFSALPVSAAIPASEAYALYRSRLKVHREPPVSKIPLGDFFIAAHAEAEGMKLVTRDPDRIEIYFPKVKLIVP